MRFRLPALAVCASLVAAAPLAAQTTFTFLNGGTVTAFGYYVGPYNGTMGTPPVPVVLNCVDFFHDVTVGEVWTANLTNLSDVADIGTTTRNSSVQLYEEAAWLTTQYASNPGSIADIQATIWNLFPTPAGYGAPTMPGSSYWLAQAQSNYQTLNYNDFWIATDVNITNPAGAQEFLIRTTSTPEPATLVLFATGLGLVALLARRRKLASRLTRSAEALA